MKPDVILTQPDNVDFPMWRHMIRKHRKYFGKIIVCISKTNRAMDLSEFFKAELSKDDVLVLPAPIVRGQNDWRNTAVNLSLGHVNSDRILFLEQDFLIHDDNFIPDVLGSSDELIIFKETNDRTGRYHPAFILLAADLLEKTTLDFTPKGQEYDHFGKFHLELCVAGVRETYLGDMGYTQPEHWEHMAGLSHNYMLLAAGQSPNYKIDRFVSYNKHCLTLPIEQSPQFLPLIQKAAAL